METDRIPKRKISCYAVCARSAEAQLSMQADVLSAVIVGLRSARNNKAFCILNGY
jgi:hypothetical protein